MTQLILKKDKSLKLIKRLEEKKQMNIIISALNDDEMIFQIPKEDETIFFNVLNELVNQWNTFWLDTFDGSIKFEPTNCLYFEFIDGEVILTTDHYKKIMVRHTLQDLEVILKDLAFQRISKQVIVNLKRIIYIRPLLNSKVELTLHGNLKLEVNRFYLKAFKGALKRKGGF